MKYIKYILIMVLVFPILAYADQTWVTIDLLPLPIYGRHGNVLPEGTRRIVYSRSAKRLNYGGGYLAPDLSDYKVLNICKKGSKAIALIDADASEINSLKTKDESLRSAITFKVKRKKNLIKVRLPQQYRDYNFKDFKVKTINDKKAEEILREWSCWQEKPIEPESGVTD